MFEWQKHSQESTDVPHYQKLLDFIDLRAQASEVSASDAVRKPKVDTYQVKKPYFKSVASHADPVPPCIVCKSEKHPLYICQKFKYFPHERMLSTLRSNNLCINCLKPGHFTRECQSSNRCKRCRRPHHTLLHLETRSGSTQISTGDPLTHDSRLQSDAPETHTPLLAIKRTLCFGAKYGKFLAAQKLPNLETLSCMQVVATFGNIEVCNHKFPRVETTQPIKNFQNRKLPICQNWQREVSQMWKLLMHHFWKHCVTTKFPKVELPKRTMHNTPSVGN